MAKENQIEYKVKQLAEKYSIRIQPALHLTWREMDAITNAIMDSVEPQIIPEVTLRSVHGKRLRLVKGVGQGGTARTGAQDGPAHTSVNQGRNNVLDSPLRGRPHSGTATTDRKSVV